MNILVLTKIPFFLFHILYIFITIFLPTFYSKLIFLQIFTILSWIINKNQCLLTQIEYYLYKKTLIEYVLDKKNIKNKFNVPKIQRYILYIVFLFNCIKIYYLNHNIYFYYFL